MLLDAKRCHVYIIFKNLDLDSTQQSVSNGFSTMVLRRWATACNSGGPQIGTIIHMWVTASKSVGHGPLSVLKMG